MYGGQLAIIPTSGDQHAVIGSPRDKGIAIGVSKPYDAERTRVLKDLRGRCHKGYCIAHRDGTLEAVSLPGNLEHGMVMEIVVMI